MNKSRSTSRLQKLSVCVLLCLAPLAHAQRRVTRPRTEAESRPSPISPAQANASVKNEIVCHSLAAKKDPASLWRDAIPFAAPRGDGRSGANGFLLPADESWEGKGTQWRFLYRRSADAFGVQMIHPWKDGHVIVTFGPSGVGISTVGAWTRIGWAGLATEPLILTTAYTKVFPLAIGEKRQLTSLLTSKGVLRISIGSDLVAGTVIRDAKTLDLTIPQGTRPPACSSWGELAFSGAGLPTRIPRGHAGIVIGPCDTGYNTADRIWFMPTPALVAPTALARVDVTSGGRFQTLSTGEELWAGSGWVWESFGPKSLDGVEFLQNRDKHQGALEFRVKSSGRLLMACTRRWGGGGNSFGGWKGSVVTPEQLKRDGWKASDAGLRATRRGHQGSSLDWEVFERFCRQGESFRYRTEKYAAPILIRNTSLVVTRRF